MEGEGEGSNVWRPMEGEGQGEGSFSPLPISPPSDFTYKFMFFL